MDGDRAEVHRQVRDLRQLGDVLLHQRVLQAVGRLLTEIDIGIWEESLDDETWAGWHDFKTEIAKVTLKRRLDQQLPRDHAIRRRELVPEEMGGGWDVR